MLKLKKQTMGGKPEQEGSVSMRVINTVELVPLIRKLTMKACIELDDNLIGALEESEKREESPLGKEIIGTLVENARAAKDEGLACCQDTGILVVYLSIGQEVVWQGNPLEEMVNEGVRQGYRDGYLRNSVVLDPFLRENSGDNTPCVLHTDIIPGDRVKILVMPKGAGSENMGRVQVLTPAQGKAGVKDFVVETVEKAGGKACPPLIVGVGVGGTMEKSAFLAKEALKRPIGERHREKHIAELEDELLEEINRLGIGPLGVGGRITALDVHIEVYPCHIASLPVAVNLQCHANRHAEAVL